jgi:hypothetical protein
MLDLSTLEACCRRELEKGFLLETTTARFSRELLRRAISHDNQQAWEAWQRCFTETVRRWLRRHPRAEEACQCGDEELYVARTFECFQQVMAAGQVPASTSLPIVLRYLQACLNGVLLDALRSKARPQGSPLQEPADPEEQAGENHPDAHHGWVHMHALSHRFSRRNLLLGGVAAVGLAGVASAWRGLSQQASLTSLEAIRSSRPAALLSKGKTLYVYRRHADAVFSVAWSPDGTALASGSFDRTVLIWNASTGTHTVTYRGHTNSVNSLAWSPEGTPIASGSTDTTVQVWQAI